VFNCAINVMILKEQRIS